MIKLGLCCQFAEQPIKFRAATVKKCQALEKAEEGSRLPLLSEICLANVRSLLNALKFCASNNIGCFRITSRLFPVYTHSTVGYILEDLQDHEAIVEVLKACHDFAKRYNIRLSMHPDQFNVLTSEKPSIVKQTVAELEYHNVIAEYLGADVINIHGGGAYGDKKSALARFEKNFGLLSASLQSKLTLENDDKTYTPEDLLPVCRNLRIPLLYDVHHHRCCKDTFSVEKATDLSISTWTDEKRKPMFHISSPIEGWDGPKPFRHHGYINIKDFPDHWLKINTEFTIEVEAKQKELAVKKLTHELGTRGLKNRLFKCDYKWNTYEKDLQEATEVKPKVATGKKRKIVSKGRKRMKK